MTLRAKSSLAAYCPTWKLSCGVRGTAARTVPGRYTIKRTRYTSFSSMSPPPGPQDTQSMITVIITNLNSNSKALILKDSSVRCIWTNLTASPCPTKTQISTTELQTYIISTNKQLVNAVSLSCYKYAEIPELNVFHGHTCIQQ